MTRLLGFGDNIVDRYLDRGMDFPGGNAVNVAVYARRLGAEAEYLGVFGDDELSTRLRAAVEDAGVPTPRSVTRRGEAGVSSLHVVGGERTFLGWNGGGITVREPIDLDDGREDYVATFDVVHTSVYSGVESQLPRLRGRDVLLSYDLSSEDEYRTDDYLRRVAPHTDLVLLSCEDRDEAASFALLDRAIAHGAPLALGTRGTRGAIVTDGTQRFSAPARLVNDSDLVDTMGCGDAFMAGFLLSLQAAGWRRDAAPTAAALHDALCAGADSAYEQCFVESAFGRGWPTPATVSMK